MIIERDGKQYELTYEELSEANTEFVTNWMKKKLIEDFDVPEDIADYYAAVAYEYYCREKGTEYECVELAYDDYCEEDDADETDN